MREWVIQANTGQGGTEPDLTWIRRSERGVESATGTTPPAFWPDSARNVLLLLPPGQVFIGRVKLPTRAAGKVRAMLPYAVEDQIASDPEQIHAVLGPQLANGESVVGVVDKVWMSGLLDHLRGLGVEVGTALPLHLLLPWQAGHWSVYWDGREAWLREGAAQAQTLDTGEAARPPFALLSALEEARARDEAPQAVDLYLGPDAMEPDVEQWTAQLDLPVFYQGKAAWPWLNNQADARPLLNMAQGLTQDGTAVSAYWPKFRAAAILLLLILGVQIAGTLAEWWKLKREADGLRAQMESTFRRTFPDAKVVVDPALQMERQLASLRDSSGAALPSDFLVLLSQFASAMTGRGGMELTDMQYQDRSLTLDVRAKDPAAVNGLMTALKSRPLRVETPAVTPTASGVALQVRLRGEGS